ncbi:hypothetical protein AXF14_09840 [Actinomyces radicidentis]|uniref:Uncharacterized protein n=1 Tax=Actinomyces radicidentis TaxID=111015 RepID=A0A0X8JFV2_ACTRD|nr:hypothetical protein [Actinomyces radicidentis]AMD87827.1 hypothetical protein AXF14_09840 [Actinomyces radicidentis]
MADIPWWEIIGWTGSVLVVLSLMVPSVRRFRRLNLAGSLIATVYNAVFGIWPYAAGNAAITIIDLYWPLRLRRAGERRYSVCPARPDDAVVAGFVERHRSGIEQAYPGALDRLGRSSARTCFLTLCDDEVVGLFAMESVDDGAAQGAPATARVLVDWVTDRFRDLKPGRALYAHPALAATGVSALVVDPAAVADPGYFARMGFVPGDGVLSRAL